MVARVSIAGAYLLLAAAFVLVHAFDRPARGTAGAERFPDDGGRPPPFLAPEPRADEPSMVDGGGARVEDASRLPAVDRPDAVLAGRVVDPDGRPVPLANLSLRAKDGTRLGHVALRTDAEGSFRIPRLGAGRLQLVVWPDNRSGSEEDGTLLGSRVVEDVEPGGAELVVVLPRARFTRGRVLDAAGQALAKAYVTAKTASGYPVAAVLTDAEGRFQVVLAEGEAHELAARPPAVPGPAREASAVPEDTSTFARQGGVTAGMQGVDLRFP